MHCGVVDTSTYIDNYKGIITHDIVHVHVHVLYIRTYVRTCTCMRLCICIHVSCMHGLL